MVYPVRLRALEERDRLAFLQGHDGLLPVRAATDAAADALVLAARDRRADRGDVHREELLHGVLHLDLRRVAVHLERVLLRGLAVPLRLLGDERALHHVLIGQHHDRLASSFFAVSAVITRTSCRRMSYTLSPSAARKSEPRRLRTLFASAAFSAASTTSAFFTPSLPSTFDAIAVLGAAGFHSETMRSFPSRLR